LISHPSDLRSNTDFVNFLKDTSNKAKGDSLAKLIVDGTDVGFDVIGLIMKFRIVEYMGKSSSDREKD